MTDINTVVVVGRLTKDAELKFTSASTPVARFSLAVNRSRKSGDQWEDEVSYIDISFWGKAAENLSKYMSKGKQIAVEGELRQERWEKDGQSHSRLVVVAHNIQLLGGTGEKSIEERKREFEAAPYTPSKAPEPEPFNDEGIPF